MLSIFISMEISIIICWLTTTLIPSDLDLSYTLPVHLLFSVNLPIETPDIPCSKSHIHFPLLTSFSKVRPIQRPCLSFRNKLFCGGCYPHAQSPNWRAALYRLSRYCLFCIFAATLRICRPSPPSEDAPCRGSWFLTYK